MVCSQSKILTSAFWNVLLLRVQISRKQYIALFWLMGSMIMVQSGDHVHRSASSEMDHVRWSQLPRGIIVVLIAALTSGFAGLYLEKIYTEYGARKRQLIWFRNTQLACISLPTAVIIAFWCDGERLRTFCAFQGYDRVVFIIITLQAFGGLIVAVVLRYAGNILKCFAVSISICSCAMLSTFFDEDSHPLSLRAVLGVAFVICSMFLYST